MRAAILNQANVVVRVILLDALDQYPGAIDGAGADVGDTWNGAAFVKPVPGATPVPNEVSMAQARVSLNRAGITEAAIDNVIAGLPPGDAKVEAGIWWRNATSVHRDSSIVASISGLLGLTSGQVDALFVAAASITP